MLRSRLVVRNGEVLTPQGLEKTDLGLAMTGNGSAFTFDPTGGAQVMDASGLLVLPGLIDVHGDAFERQIMPRPGVGFALDLALMETDRQMAANGITTAFHGVTRSWEPGLRDLAHARGLLEAMERLGPHLTVDTRFHLRHETFTLDDEDEILDWIGSRRIGALAFNDHMTGTIKVRHRPDKMAKMVERSGLGAVEFGKLVDRVAARADEVPASIERLAAAAQATGVPAMSHDDMSVAQRCWYRSLGVGIAEFPLTDEVAAAASRSGEPVVFGAPNVVRGGSHTGCPDAAQMVLKGWGSVLASDYFYPALLQAPFILQRRHGLPLEQAWRVVSANAALALGLTDRGEIVPGKRADLVVVQATPDLPARVVATIADGRLVYLADGGLLSAA
ncbi:MAG: alpha-D-ribose 1-methylphosphonate 5-triphosphate diphosphatase [Hyphomicrobiaceae bacterium]